MTFTVEILLRLLLSAILGGLIGVERGRHGRAAGLRTHILVSVGAALITAVGVYTVGVLGFSADPMRAAAQVISGIGFLGAGTILVRDRFQITGLTTAAGLWTTAAIGLATGVGFYAAAILASAIVLAVHHLLPRIEKSIKGNDLHYVYVELNDSTRVNDFMERVRTDYGDVYFHITKARSGLPGHVGVDISLGRQQRQESLPACKALSLLEYVDFAVPND